MKIYKFAKINLILQILQLSVVCENEYENIIDIQQIEKNKQYSFANKILKKDLDCFKNKNLIKQNQIILDVITDINPVQITSSCDCQPAITCLKQLQDSLLEKDYKIKIIL